METLSSEARAIIEEEEAHLQRVREAIRAARASQTISGDTAQVTQQALRSLRDQTADASEDDLPTLLADMHVRQRLSERAEIAPLPEEASPYIAHLRLLEGNATRDYFLGQTTFLETQANIRVVDWRTAPVAQVFYRYAEGDAFEEEFPGRVVEGRVLARRLVVIQGGTLRKIVGDGAVLVRGTDGTWRQESGSKHSLDSAGVGTAARPGTLGLGVGTDDRQKIDITSLLDAEQYAAICVEPEKPLLVLGSAGSGKTTVALHRLARIHTVSPEKFPLGRMEVVVPEEGLARLSRRWLEPLGARKTRVRTLDTWATELAQEIFGENVKLSPDAPGVTTSLKRHPALYHALGRYFQGKRVTTFEKLRKQLAAPLTDRAFLTDVVKSANGEISGRAVEDTVRHTMAQLRDSVDKELRSITVAELKVGIDGRSLGEGTPEELAGTVDLEDLPILLFLKAAHGDFPEGRCSHLVLDEAEDFSLFELFVLGRTLSKHRSVTLAGDEAQQTHASFAGWQPSLSTLGVGDAATCRLSVSYRCPGPVTELARKLLGNLAPEKVTTSARPGAPVGTFDFPSLSQAQLFVAGALRDLMDREPRACVGVIAKDEAGAKEIYQVLRDMPQARFVTEGNFNFEPGIDVTDVDNAKGLEWDYVIVPDATQDVYPDNPDARRRLHVAVTRTSHQLWLVSGGARSQLVSLG